MPKKPHARSATNVPAPRTFYGLQPWRYVHHADRSEIRAYAEVGGAWETVATVHPTAGASAEFLAVFVVDCVNDHQHQQHLLHAALAALEAVTKEGLTYSTEQEIDAVLARMKRQGH